MVYNPVTYRWEGNDNELTLFDRLSSPTPTALPPHLIRDNAGSPNRLQRENQSSTPRPALITNINSLQHVQRIKNMVFDPIEMCWHKVPSSSSNRGKSDAGDTMDGFDALDDEEDVFKDVPDLVDSPKKEDDESGRKSNGADADWLVGEEFDVGPEFIRRQRDEEDRWRKKCRNWLGVGREDEDETWRWRIRDVIADVVDEL